MLRSELYLRWLFFVVMLIAFAISFVEGTGFYLGRESFDGFWCGYSAGVWNGVGAAAFYGAFGNWNV